MKECLLNKYLLVFLIAWMSIMMSKASSWYENMYDKETDIIAKYEVDENASSGYSATLFQFPSNMLWLDFLNDVDAMYIDGQSVDKRFIFFASKGEHVVLIKLKRNVRTLKNYTFCLLDGKHHSGRLIEVRIPSCITNIEPYNFIECPYLQRIFSYATQAPIKEKLRKGTDQQVQIYVDNYKNIYSYEYIFAAGDASNAFFKCGYSAQNAKLCIPENAKGYDANGWEQLKKYYAKVELKLEIPSKLSVERTKTIVSDYVKSQSVDEGSDFFYNLGDKTIADVNFDKNSIIVKGLKVGKTQLKTVYYGIERYCDITITPLKMTSIELPKTITLITNKRQTLKPKIIPEDADDKDGKNFIWKSEDESIATVTQDGVVSGIGYGKTRVTCMASDDSNLSASCEVVNSAPITIDLSTKTLNLQEGSSYGEQKVNISGKDFSISDVLVKSLNENVVSVDENGVIKAGTPGIATIRYYMSQDENVYADCKVIVYEDNVVYVGGLYYLLKGTTEENREATVTSIYGGKNKSLDAEKVAQVYTGTVSIPEQTTFNAVTYDVKKVGGYAFTCQNELQALRVGAFVEKIEDNAATKAMNLNRVTVANASQLVTVGKRSFMDCAGLQHVLFEGTTQYLDVIDTAAFKNCAKLEDVIWEGKSTLRLIGDSAFYCDSKLETVKWNDKCDLKIIDNYAFYKCSSLNHFIMPNSTLSVGKYAFRYDAGLTDIQLSTSLSIIYDYAFGECGFSQLILPESLKSMQAGAFINNSNLADITIPKKTEGIGAGAFENCSALESVTFKTHETKLTVDKNAFNHCAVLSKVNIDYLDDWAHINFQNAAANPASTAHRLYLNGEELLDVELPVGTKYIGNNVFNGCSDIRTLKIPATVEHVNDNIIAGCSSLTDVYCYATKVPSFIGTEDPSSMNDVFRKATLHVIYGNEEAYKADAWWKRFYKIEGCKDPGVEDVKVSSITISQTEITLKPDDTLQLEATVYPTEAANKSVIWKSSNEDVVIVTDEGFVLAVAEGEADVTVASAENSEIKAVCHIKVEKEKEPEVPIVQIKFEESPVTIALGETKKLNVIFNPVNATNKELDWVSAKSSVVEVDKEGNILGVSEGKAIVSAKTKDGSNLTINCVVTVIPSTGISNITMGEVKLIVNNRHLKVEGLADHEVIQVVNSIGFTVYRGTDHEIDLKAAGVYIIKVKGKTLKFSVK